MTIAEKLTKIAENEQKVYDAGYARGYDDGEIVGGGSYDEGFEDGKQAGRKAEYDAFWDAIQNYGNRTDYRDAFNQSAFEYIRPKYKIAPTKSGGATRVVYDSDKLKKIEAKYFDLSQVPRGAYAAEGMYWTFGTCAELEEIEDVGLSPSYCYTYTFAWCGKLKTIAKITVDEDTKFDTTFQSCYVLENITFEGEIGNDINFQWSTKLTRASIESIVSHLSDKVSGKTLTLSKTAADTAFPCWYENENGEWVNVGCGANGEWLELIAPKVENGKWIIDLV